MKTTCIIRAKCNKNGVGLKFTAVERGGLEEGTANALNYAFSIKMVTNLIRIGKGIDIRIPSLGNRVPEK